MESSRLEAFSDGVLAVAITLLALNLSVAGPGHGPLGDQLRHHLPAYGAYVVSFFTIGIIWVNHHSLFGGLRRIDRTLLFLNLVLLMFVVAIPFATTTLADYLTAGGDQARLAAVVYCLVMLGMAVSFSLLFWWPVRQGYLLVALSPAQRQAALWRFSLGVVVYLGCLVVALFSAPLTLLFSALIDGYYIFERTAAAGATAPESGSGSGSGPPAGS